MKLQTRAALALAASLVLAPWTGVRAEDIVASHYGALMHGAPLAVAVDKGWFKEAGLDIEGVLTSKGGGTSVRNLMAGSTLYGEVALPAAVAAIQQGYDIKIINSATIGSGGFFVARPGNKIQKPADLQGKRLAYSQPKSVSEAIWLSILKTQNIPLSSVTMVATGDIAAGITALEAGKVDIAIISEPLLSQAQKRGHDYTQLSWLDDAVPSYTQTVGIATSDVIAHHADQLTTLMKVRNRAVQYIYDHPEDAAASIGRQWRLPAEIVLSSIRNTRKLTDHWWTDGTFDRPSMDNSVEASAASGDIKLPVDWSAMIDTHLLPGGVPAGM